MENRPQWGEDTAPINENIGEKALSSQAEKTSNLDREIMQLEVRNEYQRRIIDFISKRIDVLNQENTEHEDLVSLLDECRKKLHHIVLLNEVYKRSIKMSSEEYTGEDLNLLTDLQGIDSNDDIQKIDITSFTSKHPYDDEMINNIRFRQQELALELAQIGDVLKKAYPEEFSKIGEFFKKDENRVN